MLELIVILITVAAAMFVGAALAYPIAEGRHRRQHGATAQCAACNWESDRLPLAAAFNAAAAHTATPAANGTDRHRGFVVKA